MGYKFSFIDNESYGTDDINAAISRLTTSGVSVCPTEGNLINAMNAVTAEAATDGVEYDMESCRVTDAEEGLIKISGGTAFFENGVSMTLDGEGITLAKESERYVYLYHDIESNSCYAALGAEFPEHRFVPLAYIDSEGNITDRRKYAMSKLAPNAPHEFFTYTSDINYAGSGMPDEVLVLTMNVGHPNFTYVGFKNSQWSEMGFDAFGEDGYTSYMDFCNTRPAQIRFKKAGATVEVYVKRNKDAQIPLGVRFFVF